MAQDFCSFSTTAWTDICSSATAPALLYYTPSMALCNICIHHIHVDYAGGRAMQEQRSGVPRRKNGRIVSKRNKHVCDKLSLSFLAR
jgi:hypothetical protein